MFVKNATRVNNGAANAHQPTRCRECVMCGLRDSVRAQALLLCFDPTREYFALPRHRMTARSERAKRKACTAAWHQRTVTEFGCHTI